ncbi:LOW QUALITY PROTEIN: amphoterin-induced protein 3 [Osmerus mordax]|uniref:LOW QUALITY PROTEIN: amphoterin-induced protein 3 n=1 Tax=Osmerus mordax TaxID=8014 RepID=UPI00350FF2A7
MARAGGMPAPLVSIGYFLFLPLLRLAEASCPSPCVCASDILSCSAAGLKLLPSPLPPSTATLDLNHNLLVALVPGAFSSLPRLHTLRLAHNRLSRLEPRTFQNASLGLRHLDLSSNQLDLLDRHWFLELPGLQELLLFNNHIVKVESLALAGLGMLRQLYLSHNFLTEFPFSSIQKDTHPYLSTLDLSSNQLLQLPLDEISALPATLQSALYLHNNTLTCDCSMYGLFRHWEQQDFGSVKDFRREHTCRLYGDRRASVRFLEHGGSFGNSAAAPAEQQGAAESSLQGYVGDALLLDCVTRLRGRDLHYLWVLPQQAYVAAPGNDNGSLRVFANGSLEILSVRAEDSGVYLCMVQDRGRQRNETWEVNVTVALRGQEAEPFNTGFTTLLGCVVSLVLVLMYLYLTPCRCCCRKTPAPAANTPSPGNEASAQSSILTPTPPATTEGPGCKVSNNKHVVFLEPIREQNGRLRAEPPKLLQSQRGDTDSIISVFSDTPIVP